MNRTQAIPYVAYIVDDAGSGRTLGADPHAIVRSPEMSDFKYASALVGWQCGFEPLFVAVHSYLDVALTEEEATELATDYLDEIGWFSNGPTDPDFVIL
jgi:hypothetical protein